MCRDDELLGLGRRPPQVPLAVAGAAPQDGLRCSDRCRPVVQRMEP